MDVLPETGSRRRSMSNVSGTHLSQTRFQQLGGGLHQVPHMSTDYRDPRTQLDSWQQFDNREALQYSSFPGQPFRETEDFLQDRRVAAANAIHGRPYDSNIAGSGSTVSPSHTYDLHIQRTNSIDTAEASGIRNLGTDIEMVYPYQAPNAYIPRPTETQLPPGTTEDCAGIINVDLGYVGFPAGALAMHMQSQIPQEMEFPPGRVCQCDCHSIQNQGPIVSRDRMMRAGPGVNTANDNITTYHGHPDKEQNGFSQNIDESRRSYSFQDPGNYALNPGGPAFIGLCFSALPVSPGSSNANPQERETIPSQSPRHNLTRAFSSAAPTQDEQTGGISATWIDPTPGAAPQSSGFPSPNLGGDQSHPWDETSMIPNARIHGDLLAPSGYSSRREVGTTGSRSSWTEDQSLQTGQQKPVFYARSQDGALEDPRGHSRRRIPKEAQRRSGSLSAPTLRVNRRSQRSLKRPSGPLETAGFVDNNGKRKPKEKRMKRTFNDAERQEIKDKRGKVKDCNCGCHQRKVKCLHVGPPPEGGNQSASQPPLVDVEGSRVSQPSLQSGFAMRTQQPLRLQVPTSPQPPSPQRRTSITNPDHVLAPPSTPASSNPLTQRSIESSSPKSPYPNGSQLGPSSQIASAGIGAQFPSQEPHPPHLPLSSSSDPDLPTEFFS